MKKALVFVLALALLFVFVPLGQNTAKAAGATWLFSVNNGNAYVSAFTQSANQTVVDIPSKYLGNDVIGIEENAFTGCPTIETINTPDISASGKTFCIQYQSFVNCPKLKTVFLSKSVTDVRYDNFTGCPSLLSFLTDNDNPNYASIDGVLFNKSKNELTIFPQGRAGSYSIPAGTYSMWSRAFSENKLLTQVTMPASLTDPCSFYGCSGLTSIVVDSSNPALSSLNGVLYDKAKTVLYCCPDAKTGIYTIPGTVKKLDKESLSGCGKLTGIVMPNSVTEIGDYAFECCSHLTSLTVPNSVVVIGEGAFSGCTGLVNINLSNCATGIHQNAFMGCTGLKSIVLPAGITVIETSLFLNCSELSSVTISGNVTNINNAAFCSCSKLQEIILPASVINISQMVFGSCQALKAVYFLGPRPTIDDAAFYDNAAGFKVYYLMNQAASWSSYTNTDKQACYLVSFNSNGGTSIQKRPVPINAVLPVPMSPTRSGYSFGGWYKEAACTNAWNFATDNVTSDITLYAKWTINSYTVSFNSQGGTAVANKTAQYNSTISAPAAPTRTGYTFAGWYKEAACTNVWNFATDKVAGDTILYAKWIANPSTPVGVKAISASYNSIKISWSSSADPTMVEIWREPYGASSYSAVGTSASTSFTDSGLSTGTKYYYKVRAYRWSGSVKVCSPWSSAVYSMPVPAAPASVKAVPVTYNSIKVTWGAVAGTTKYKIYRATSNTGTYSLLTETAAISYTNTGVNTGTTYYYKVKAYRLVGSTQVFGDSSAVVSAKTSLAAPASVKATRASPTSIKTSWDAVAGATMYEVNRATTNGGTFTYMTTTSSLCWTNTGLETGKTYWYKVRAYRLVGSVKVYSSFSAVVNAKP